MDTLAQKDFTSSRDLTYHYYLSDLSKADNDKPTLLFLHGFPDSSALWQFIAPNFVTLGYRVLIPDLLGYGGSSKPADAALYGVGDICKDLNQLLEAEGIDKIIPLGHDWGSGVAQRMWLFFPERCQGIILLSVAYTPPMPAGAAGPKTHHEMNDFYEKRDGYRRFEYHDFFLADDAAKIWEDHAESAWSAMHGDNGIDGMKHLFCEPGAMRQHLLSDGQVGPLKKYAADPTLRDAWIKGMKTHGATGAFNWYHAIWNGRHAEAEKYLPEGRAVVKVPMLFLSCDEDVVCLASDIDPHVQAGLLPDLTMHTIHSGHWVPYEAPEEVTRLIKEWLETKQL